MDRVFQVLEGIGDNDIYNQLVVPANEMAELLPTVRQLCADAQALTPSDDEVIPAATARVHRALTKSANDLATTAQVIAMMRMQAEAGGPIDVAAVEHRTRIVKEDLETAVRVLSELK